jgi:predicted NBD/HSP70 family sugar kinase
MAREVILGIADRMARVIAVFGTLLNPDLVVIGGAVAASADLLMDPIAERLLEYTSTPPVVLATALGDHGVVTGAVRLALDRVESTMLRGDLRDLAEA